MLAIPISASESPSKTGSPRTLRSMARPANPKNTGMNKATINPRNSSSMCWVNIGDCPIMTPAMNAPNTVCTPMKSVTSASKRHDDQDYADDRHLDDEVIVRESNQLRHPSAANREAERRNAATPKTLNSTGPSTIFPCAARPPMNARIVQPIVSSKMAAARMTWPRFRRRKSPREARLRRF